MRGDGPFIILRYTYLNKDFPACAGMDPTETRDNHVLDGFPRVRGDGPTSHDFSVTLSAISPRARGWTRKKEILAALSDDFPAYAGMDP